MRLLDYLKETETDDETFAEKVGLGATGRAVRKWKYGETTPRLPTVLRIEEVTGRRVTASDFVTHAAQPAENAA